MNVLVAGGAGYIGSNMTAMLARAGYEPIVFDNLSKGHKAAVKDAEFVQGDLADNDLLVEILKKYKIEVSCTSPHLLRRVKACAIQGNTFITTWFSRFI